MTTAPEPRLRIVAAVERVGSGLGAVAGWLYFLTGVMIVWEVVARYVFVAPTIWAEELSRFLLLWGTFLPMAVLLRRRGHIRITLLRDRLGSQGRTILDLVSIAVIGAFALFVARYGWDIARDSMAVGRTTGTMLDLPQWLFEAVIPIAFALLTAQCVVEAARLLWGDQAAAGNSAGDGAADR